MVYGELEKGTAAAAGICGILILLCGVGDCITGFVWLSYVSFAGVGGGFGLWSGVGLVVAGILGIVAWVKKNKGVLIGFLVLCILMIIVCAVQAILAGVVYTIYETFVNPGSCRYMGNYCYCGSSGTKYDASVCRAIQSISDIFLTITVLSAFGSIFSLAGSIIGCIGACASAQQPGAVVIQQPAVIVSTAAYPHPAQLQQLPPGYVVQQPGAYPMAQYPQMQPQYAPTGPPIDVKQ